MRCEQGDAFALAQADASVDLLVCRHMSQAVPDFPRVLAEFARVLKPGGWLHLLSEDYGMLHMRVGVRDPDRSGTRSWLPFLDGIGCDGRIGRHSPTLLANGPVVDVAMDYITVDTLRGAARRPSPASSRPGATALRRRWPKVRRARSTMSTPSSMRSSPSIRISPDYAVWHVPSRSSGRRP